jgi:hypothetical protein
MSLFPLDAAENTSVVSACGENPVRRSIRRSAVGTHGDQSQLHKGSNDDVLGTNNPFDTSRVPGGRVLNQIAFRQHPVPSGLSAKTAIVDKEDEISSLPVPAL